MKRLVRRPLSIPEIVVWASAYREATGKCPTKDGGPIAGAKFESWPRVAHPLRLGLRDFPGGSSLAQLLAQELGARNIHDLPPLTIEQILRWADEHHARTGEWPTAKSGVIPNSGGETWASV